jgi:Zn-dependent protease
MHRRGPDILAPMLENIIGILSNLSLPQLVIISVLPVLFAITVHEVAHGWIAQYLGDPTAQRLGRVTLNPIKHIDPLGTILVPAALLLIIAITKSGFLFGWAKPVPVTWENLRHPKRDMVIVAAAGPAANLLMAVLWGTLAKIATVLPPAISVLSEPMFFMGLVGILINVLLMVFNLLPLPPLDGGRVAVGLLPNRMAWHLSRIEPFGFMILLTLMITGFLWVIIGPPIRFSLRLVTTIVGLS